MGAYNMVALRTNLRPARNLSGSPVNPPLRLLSPIIFRPENRKLSDVDPQVAISGVSPKPTLITIQITTPEAALLGAACSSAISEIDSRIINFTKAMGIYVSEGKMSQDSLNMLTSHIADLRNTAVDNLLNGDINAFAQIIDEITEQVAIPDINRAAISDGTSKASPEKETHMAAIFAEIRRNTAHANNVAVQISPAGSANHLIEINLFVLKFLYDFVEKQSEARKKAAEERLEEARIEDRLLEKRLQQKRHEAKLAEARRLQKEYLVKMTAIKLSILHAMQMLENLAIALAKEPCNAYIDGEEKRAAENVIYLSSLEAKEKGRAAVAIAA
ncbi:MAG: hypothetical protein WC527_01980 [Candidatus Margulisiibacteriota bacterium]